MEGTEDAINVAGVETKVFKYPLFFCGGEEARNTEELFVGRVSFSMPLFVSSLPSFLPPFLPSNRKSYHTKCYEDDYKG